MTSESQEPGSKPLLQAVIRDHAVVTDGSMGAFARRLGFHDNRISKWMTGYCGPSADSLGKLSDDMGIPVEDLLRLSQISVRQAAEIVLRHPEDLDQVDK